jgi:hypothetical protein
MTTEVSCFSKKYANGRPSLRASIWEAENTITRPRLRIIAEEPSSR